MLLPWLSSRRSRALGVFPAGACAAWILGLGAVWFASCGDTETESHTPFNQLISAGECTSCAVEAGKLYCWGKLDGDMGAVSPPKLIATPKPAIMMAVGKEHGCVLLDEIAGMYCWGKNDSGQLGVLASTDPMALTKTPVKSQFSAESKQIIVGNGFTCVLANGGVKCAGGSVQGTLGNGPDVKSDIPLGVPSLGTIRAIAGGDEFACALDNGGVVSCWGQNHAGQTGQMDNDTTLFAAHVTVPTADALFAGGATACAHTTEGYYCWGDNGSGLFGDAMLPGGSTPVRAPALDKYSDFTFGETRACGKDSSGNIDCWGQELAKNPMKNVAPTPVTALTKPNAVTTGFHHHCAWDGGYVYCWGQNDCGQVGAVGQVVPDPTVIVLHDGIGGGGAPATGSTTASGSSSTGQ